MCRPSCDGGPWVRDDRGDGGMAQEEGDLWRKGKRMEKEITRRWTTRFAWNLVSVLAKSYYALSFSPLAPFPLLLLSPLFHSRSLSLPLVSPRSLLITLSLSFSLFPSETSRCVRTNTSEKSFTLTNTDARPTSHTQPCLSFALLSSHTRFSPPL